MGLTSLGEEFRFILGLMSRPGGGLELDNVLQAQPGCWVDTRAPRLSLTFSARREGTLEAPEG